MSLMKSLPPANPEPWAPGTGSRPWPPPRDPPEPDRLRRALIGLLVILVAGSFGLPWLLRTFGGPGLARRDAVAGPLNAGELQLKNRLLEELVAERPTHRLTYRNGQTLTGYLLSETPDAYVFREQYGSAAALDARVARLRVASLEVLPVVAPDLSDRDVKFCGQFRDLRLFLRPPYTILSNDSYFEIEHSVRALREMHTGFMEAFGALVRPGSLKDGVQVLYYSDQEAFEECRRHYAPQMKGVVGFYSADLDRLVLFNTRSSKEFGDASKMISDTAAEYEGRNLSGDQRARLSQWKADQGRVLHGMAEELTLTVARHEGAHQLFFAGGIHSAHGAEGNWLTEGLAVYCETPRFGGKDPLRVKSLAAARDGGRLIALDALLDCHSRRGLGSFGAAERVDLAYSQSWALVHMLMQPAWRKGFFAYLQYVRDEAQARRVSGGGLPLLCERLGITEGELERQYADHLRAL